MCICVCCTSRLRLHLHLCESAFLVLFSICNLGGLHGCCVKLVHVLACSCLCASCLCASGGGVDGWLNLTEIDPDEEVQGEIHLHISVLGDGDTPTRLRCQVMEAR